MLKCLTEYYRCPDEYLSFAQTGALCKSTGYFQFGRETTCYGSYAGRELAADDPAEQLNALDDIKLKNGTVYLPFDPCEVINNLRYETYAADWRANFPMSALAAIYYFARPLLPLQVRKPLQKFHFRNWRKLEFPRWPVDCSVDNLLSQLLSLSLKASGIDKIPFIWFWPRGARSCAMVTHDVETQPGFKFCGKLMDLDHSFGIRSSFQVIPEQRYSVTAEFLNSIRDGGFEIVVHDLNHDGHLYQNRKQFLERAARINQYATAYGAEGFRAGSLYRKQLWYDALNVSYDTSIPNVAHLDPQQGGCCTVMPYFIGNIVELPVTTTQDYTLFNILNDYSIELWKQQMEIILAKHGLISFIVHPDYIIKPQHRRIYEALLACLTCLQEEHGLWIAAPGDVSRWWRQRAEMRLIEGPDGWRIEGPGNERASVAYATLDNGDLKYEVDAVSAGTRSN
jgi:hypothetical protein